MKNSTLLALLVFCSVSVWSQNEKPQIQNLQAIVEQADQVRISYDLTDAEGDPIDVSLHISDNEGRTYSINSASASGDLGFPIAAGTDKEIVWPFDGAINLPGVYRLMLIADDQQPLDIAQIVAQVDTNRLRQNLIMVNGIRHRTANPAQLARVKENIEVRFSLACDWSGSHTFNYSGYQADNILGKLSGRDLTDSLYIIDAHYDTVDNSPGADDNGSGVAGFLEAMRVLSDCVFEHDIQFIGFDLEEAGLVGSNNYLNSGGLLPEEKLAGVFNFEMIGYFDDTPNSQTLPTGFETLYPDAYAAVESQQFRGNFITNVGNVHSSVLVTAFDSAAVKYVPGLRVISLLADASGLTPPDLLRSDHAPFWFGGKRAVMLTDGAEFRNPYYHSPEDQMDKLDLKFMRQVVQATVAAVAELAKPIHASQAFADFEILTNASEPDCMPTAAWSSAQQRLLLSNTQCLQEPLSWRLFAINGQLLESGIWRRANGQHSFAIRQAVPGIYLLELQFGREKLVQKLVLW